MNRLFGVVNGIYQCNLDRSNELNQRIYERNVPSSTLQPQFGIRPVATKYEMLPIFDRRMPATVLSASGRRTIRTCGRRSPRSLLSVRPRNG